MVIKKIILSIISIALCHQANTQSISTTCPGSDSIKAHFIESATSLAITRLYEIKSIDTLKVIVPDAYIDSTLSALLAVYSHSEIQDWKLIFEDYNIQENHPNLFNISLYIDTNFIGYYNWSHGTLLSGDPEVDSLLNKYELTLTNFVKIHGGKGIVYFHSKQRLNIKALSYHFKNVSGIIAAEEFSDRFGDGYILYTVKEGKKLLKFYQGWGDCPSGCTGYAHWDFTINGCDVQYQGRTDDPNSTKNAFYETSKIASVSPIPFENSFSIHNLSFPASLSYRITNILGETIDVGNVNGEEISLDTSLWPRSSYFIHIFSENKGYTLKCIKIQ